MTKLVDNFVDNDWSIFKYELLNCFIWTISLSFIYVYFNDNEYLFGPNPSSSNDIWLKLLSIWPYHIRWLYLLLSYLFQVIPFFAVCIYYDFLYKYKIFESYRIQLPYNKYPEKKLVLDTIEYDLIFLLLFGPLSFSLTFNSKNNFDPIPNLWTIIFKILCGIYVFDICFYITHRFLHSKLLYKYHKLHHEYKITISWAATYSTIFELIFGNIPPTILPIIIFKYHPITSLFYYLYRQIETTVGHSGYDLPFYLSPLIIFKLLPGHYHQERFHHFHHSKNDGCYGFYFIDTIFGTHKTYRKYLLQNK